MVWNRNKVKKGENKIYSINTIGKEQGKLE